MAIVEVNKQSREYIQSNPVKSTLGALGYGTVQSVNLIVDGVDFTRDLVKLGKLTLKESIIEAETSALKTELAKIDEIELYKAQLAEKRKAVLQA